MKFIEKNEKELNRLLINHMNDKDYLLNEYLSEDSELFYKENECISGRYEVFEYLEEMRKRMTSDGSEISMAIGIVTSSSSEFVREGDMIVPICEFDICNLIGIFRIEVDGGRIRRIYFISDPSIYFRVIEHDGDWATDHFPRNGIDAMELRAERCGFRVNESNRKKFETYLSDIKWRIDDVLDEIRNHYVLSEIEENQIRISDYVYASSFSYVVEKEIGGIIMSYDKNDIMKDYREYSFPEYMDIIDTAIMTERSIYLGFLEYSKNVGYKDGVIDIRPILEHMMEYAIIDALNNIAEEFDENGYTEIKDAM